MSTFTKKGDLTKRTVEREAALRMLKRQGSCTGRTIAGDKCYDARDFVSDCRQMGVTPHVAQNIAHSGGPAIDARTTRHAGYFASQWLRKRSEEIFGWGKDGRHLRKMRHRGLETVSFLATPTIGCNALLRAAKLRPDPAPA